MPPILACTPWQQPSVQNCSPRSRPDVPKKEKPQRGAGGLGGLGLLIFETKTHPVTAGIMIDERIGSLPYELNWIACIPLLLQLLGKQVADCLSV